MKRSTGLLLISFFVFAAASFTDAAFAQGTWKWGRSSTGGYAEGCLSATDIQGNVFGGGRFSSPFNFDTVSIPHASGYEAYIVKYDTAGHFQWVNYTEHSNAEIVDIAADSHGNSYLFAEFSDTAVTVSGHVLNNYSGNGYQYFLAKYSPAGSLIWVRKIGEAATRNSLLSSFTPSGAMALDQSDNVYINCTFRFNGSVGAWTVANADPSHTTEDVFVAKLDTAGTVQWVRSFGGKKNESGAGIKVGRSGAIYIAGNFQTDTLMIGSTALIDTSSYLGYSGLFCAKLDNTGHPIWARGGGATSPFVATDLALSSQEDPYITGNFQESPLVIAGTVIPAPPAGSYYCYLAKFDSSGSLGWVKQMRGHMLVAYSLTVDPCDNIWLGGEMGSFTCTDTLDGNIISSPAGSKDPMFLAAWNPLGTFVQAAMLQSGGDDLLTIAADYCGNIIVAGDDYITSGAPMVVGHDTLHLATYEDHFSACYNPGLGCAGPICNSGGEVLHQQAVNEGQPDIFPNPTDGHLTIAQQGGSYTSLSICNSVGLTVFQATLRSGNTELNISSIPAGLYYIVLTGPKDRIVKKLVRM